MRGEKRSTSAQAPGGLLDRDGMIGSEELAGWLGVPVSTLDQWASRGGGPFFHKVGVHRKYHPADVKLWLGQQRRATTGNSAPGA